MKNFYYFSKQKLKFVEIHNFYRKFVFLILFFAILFSFFIFGTFFILKEFINPDAEVNILQTENRELSDKLNDLLSQYESLDKKLEGLSVTNNELRLATNLLPIPEETNKIGIGGSVFEEINPSNSADVTKIINVLNDYVGKISIKINFEKNNYNEIKKTLSLNSKLYDAIPAILPASGTYGDRFGMRFHPVLKVRRMHNGIDIITNIGTPVYASGGGTVDYVGRRGGYGLVIEIDHGFGYRSLYSHLSSTKVSMNQKVKRGDLIALTGSSGSLSTGPHLHYEVRHNGIALNPRNFIYDDVQLFELVAKE